MTIGFRAATGLTATTDTATPFANITFTIPTGSTTGDLMLAFYGGKLFSTIPGDPTDFIPLDTIANGTTAGAGGTGSVRASAWYKIYDGSETNPQSTMPAQYTPAMTAMISLTKTEENWTVQATDAIDAASGGTGYSATAATTLPFFVGDWVIASYVHNDDSSNTTGFNITIPGCTLGTITQRLTGTLTTATGNDGRMYVVTAPITAGAATGPAVISGTTGANDSDGASIVILAREWSPSRESWGILSI